MRVGTCFGSAYLVKLFNVLAELIEILCSFFVVCWNFIREYL